MNDKKFYFSKSTEISANLLYFSMFFFSFFLCCTSFTCLSLLNNYIYWDILHLCNIVIPVINSVTFVNLKKAERVWPAETVLKKATDVFSFAVVFGLLVSAHPPTNLSNFARSFMPFT